MFLTLGVLTYLIEEHLFAFYMLSCRRNKAPGPICRPSASGHDGGIDRAALLALTGSWSVPLHLATLDRLYTGCTLAAEWAAGDLSHGWGEPCRLCPVGTSARVELSAPAPVQQTEGLLPAHEESDRNFERWQRQHVCFLRVEVRRARG